MIKLEIRSKVEKALRELPIGDGQTVESLISDIANKWQLPTEDGDFRSVLTSLVTCFQKDLKVGTEYWDIRIRDDVDPAREDKLLFIQCGRGCHWIGRCDDDHYIWVLHARY